MTTLSNGNHYLLYLVATLYVPQIDTQIKKNGKHGLSRAGSKGVLTYILSCAGSEGCDHSLTYVLSLAGSRLGK